VDFTRGLRAEYDSFMNVSLSARLLDKFIKGLVPKLYEKLFDVSLAALVVLYQWHHGQLSIIALKENTAEVLFPWVWAICLMAAIQITKSGCLLHKEMWEEAGDSITYVTLLDHSRVKRSSVPFYRTRIWGIVALCIAALAYLSYWAWESSIHASPLAASAPQAPQVPQQPVTRAVKTGHVRGPRNPKPTPCTMKVGTYYPDALSLPGGPELKGDALNVN
jgi:hypothetical protein